MRIDSGARRPQNGMIAFLIIAVLQASAARAAEESKVRQFVNRRYTEGLSYEDAKALGKGTLPELRTLLNDDRMKPRWRAIVTTIAYTGDPGSFEVLRSFLRNRFRGPVDDDTWKALLTVPNVMGTIPDSSGQVVAFLEKGTNPSFWSNLPWTEAHAYTREGVALKLSEVSINGLACTGTNRARAVLLRLKAHPYSPRQVPNITEGLAVHEEIAKRGLAAYLRRVTSGDWRPPK